MMQTLDHTRLQEAVDRITSALQPEAVYLYGSHAYGEPHEDSDVDLLVVMGSDVEDEHATAVAAYRSIRGLFLPIELKVVSRGAFEHRSRWLSSVERVIRERGRLVYGK